MQNFRFISAFCSKCLTLRNKNCIFAVSKKIGTDVFMNTITIDTNVYNGAALYAKQHGTSVKELTEKFLSSLIVPRSTAAKEPFKLKKVEELSPVIRDLIGIIPSDNSRDDMNGKEARTEFLTEKHRP